MASMNELFWSESWWLPHHLTWKDFETTNEIRKRKFSDFYIVPVLILVLLILRISFERFIALPFCRLIGINDNAQRVVPNSVCEKVFNSVTKNPDAAQIEGLSKQLEWSTKNVEMWFKMRRNASKNSLMKKATEACWRCLFYFSMFVYGCVTLLPTEWLYSSRLWFEGYVLQQDFTTALKYHYLVEFSFYGSLLFTQFLDTKRKDFYQMFVHHVVTLILIFASFSVSHFRIGAVIMFLHDASDFWLEAAKIANYAKTQKLCDGLFVCFAVTFYLTRWIYYPFWYVKFYTGPKASQ